MVKPVSSWKKIKYALISLLVLIAACKLELGKQPLGVQVERGVSIDTAVSLTVWPSASKLKPGDTAIISAELRDTVNNVALFGDTVYFSSTTGGTFPARSFAVVDSMSGLANITLRGTSKANGNVTVTAVSRRYHDTAQIIITFNGATLNLSTTNSVIRIRDTATVTALLTIDNQPVNGAAISFTALRARFPGDTTAYTTTLNQNGTASVKVTSAATGTAVVFVSVNNSRDSIMLFFDTTSIVVTPPETPGSRNFRIFSSRSQLKADNSDTATITAVLLDDNNNPAAGDTIRFKTNLGTIPSFAIVDANGRATVKLTSEATNGTCVITASSPATPEIATTKVVFSGVTVRIEADVTDQKINDNVTITALVTDASGNPNGNDTVKFTTTGGTFPYYAPPYLADPNGRAVIKVTSRTAGTITVFAASANTTDSIRIVFTNNALKFDTTGTKNPLLVGGSDSAAIVVSYVNGSGQPVQNALVTFSTNAGTIVKALDTTDALGRASTVIKSATFAGIATIVASTAAGNAVHKISFIATTPKHIKLTASPDNIGVNGIPSLLTAVVTDENSNMVTGADVNFRVLKGPGGGEHIDKPVATSQNGISHAQFFPESVPSQYRGCLIVASVGGIADTTKLTISGEPYAISVSRPQSDTVVVPKAGMLDESTFDYFVGAVVVDINGNPVADGTKVNFSSVVSGMAVHRRTFLGWSGLGSAAEKKPIYGWGVIDIPFEDINNNFRMDENDLKLDYNDAIASRGDDVNGDGKSDFDPRLHDLWYDFNGNGRVDAGATITPVIAQVPTTRIVVDSLCKDTIIKLATPNSQNYVDSAAIVCHVYLRTDTTGFTLDTVRFDTTYSGFEPFIVVDGARVWADLYPNGVWDVGELVRDVNGNGNYDVPASGDRQFWEYENLPYWQGVRFNFDKNDYGVAVTTSTPTKNGVAYAKLTYPRQLARRLVVTVNAEANGVRDRTGERFVLPIIAGQ